ncbi:hypothetical protein BCR43DRAFT_459713 [Syncephalastrum racemosum]|uniref:J domain-containing protein n=1 Tax=Syncephalastrum racemosum TaxID=13706 RepID=A0A1X2HAU7_SYNRA|nr:hypothetical protein BCR43DRAFT_459713 [Syncephalastrum racemosum]
METNKDEALRCLSIAKNHYGNGNYPAALRLTKKSINLYPTEAAQEFLSKAEKAAESQPASSPSDTPAAPKQKTQQESSSNDEKKYNPDQVAAVKRILSCGTDYYKVLSLDKSCQEVHIKKAYKKLALQFHPDKNKAPGADEAFKLISKAFSVLSDPQKRAIHDAGGGDPEQRGSSQARSGFSGFQSYGNSPFGGGDEISPEDLFNMFFGGSSAFGGPGFSSATFVGPGFAPHTYYRGGAGRRAAQQQQQQFFRARQQQQQGAHGNAWTILLQILPLLVLFGYSLLSGLFTDTDPLFSLRQTPKFSEMRQTNAHHVPYYVNPSVFSSAASTRHKLYKVEQQVEIETVRGLQNACTAEKRLRHSQLTAAGGFWGIGRNEEEYQRILKTPLKSCEELRRFGYTD